MNIPRISLCMVLVIGTGAGAAHGFQLAPVGTRHEVVDSNVNTWRIQYQAKSLLGAGVPLFVSPVHETMTQLMFSCDFGWKDCADPNMELAGPYVMAGVRWNDDPGFFLAPGEGKEAGCTSDSITFMRQTSCWIGLFKDGKQRSLQSPADFQGPGRRSNLMTRSHFGDLQFLHAMASADAESAAATKDKVMMWSQFVWSIVQGEYALGTDLGQIPLSGWSNHFVSGPNVQDLFTIGRRSVRPHIKQVAFGSLLHMVQDSFSQSHVQRREPVDGQRCADGQYRQLGRIQAFSSYVNQDHGEHGVHDSEASALTHRDMDPDVVDAGRVLVDMFKRSTPAPWSEVGRYLSECVFALENANAPAGPGVAVK
jgi:hypothetical protein